MKPRILLLNATIVTGSSSFKGHLGIEGDRIAGIWRGKEKPAFPGAAMINLRGKILMAGGIDAHVHFREPGMTAKADIASESAAALLGGITSFMDMPNTKPPTVNLATLEDKLRRAESTSAINYGFHLGATNDNAGQIGRYLALGLGGRFAGIKVFMGSSTGNMLVDGRDALETLFKLKGKTILVHCEEEKTIRDNLQRARELYGDGIPFSMHPLIRSRKACIESTRKALDMAIEFGTHLHILHVSTEEEVRMIRKAKKSNPNITAETSVNYLWFCDKDYERLGGRLKCNPAVKGEADRKALRKALADGVIDTIGSDHAPHLLQEKSAPYLQCPSGLPTIQYSLPVAISLALREGIIPLSRIASAFSEMPARIFGIKDRGFLEKGCFADLVVIDPKKTWTAGPPASKCGWSPYEGETLGCSVEKVWVNGFLAVDDGRMCIGKGLYRPRQLQFLSIG